MKRLLLALFILVVPTNVFAAVSANAIFHKTGGSDSAGGGFDPSQTGGMFTDLNCTVGTGNAAIVTSASYTFLSSTDVGHWVFIASGTNWNPGWYKISSVAGGAATLDTTLGHGQSFATGNGKFYATTVVGCSTTATNTNGATWAIDRSRVASIFWSVTGASSSTTSLTFGTGGKPASYVPGKQDVGNIIQVLTGTSITVSLYTITAATGGPPATAWTLDRSPGTSVSTCSLGGTFATIGGFGAMHSLTNVGNNNPYQRLYVTGSETIDSTKAANVAGGKFSEGNFLWVEGFNTQAGDLGPGAYFAVSGTTAITVMASTGNTSISMTFRNFVLDDASVAAADLGITSNSSAKCIGVLFANFANASAVACESSAEQCYAYNCAIGIQQDTNSFGSLYGNVADTCTIGIKPIGSAGNTIGNAAFLCGTGFSIGTRQGYYINDVAYKCTGDGFGGASNQLLQSTVINGVAYGNGTTSGYQFNTLTADSIISNSAGDTSGLGQFHTQPALVRGMQTLTSDPFSGNNIGGGTDLAVNASTNTWVKPTSSVTPQASDVGLNLYIYGGASWTPGIYTITGFDSGTGSWILNYSPAATSTGSGKFRIADFRANNVSGGGQLLKKLGISPAGQVSNIDIGAVQHADPPGGGASALVP